jgi:two-component system, LuxR family, response regulator FixJ
METQRVVSRPRPVVLVVDEDEDARNSLKTSLEIEGFAVRGCTDGADLLNTGELPGTDCLVVDYNLTDMTGLEVLGELRDREVSVPAILITSRPNQALRDRAAAAGARLIEKPLMGDALAASIRDVLARHPPASFA